MNTSPTFIALPPGGTERPFLLELSSCQREILETVFGPAALRDVTDDVRDETGTLAFRRRKQEPLELSLPVLRRAIADSEMLGKSLVLERLPEIYTRFILAVDAPPA